MFQVLSVSSGALCLLLVTSNDLAAIVQEAYNTYYYLENPNKYFGVNGTEKCERQTNTQTDNVCVCHL